MLATDTNLEIGLGSLSLFYTYLHQSAHAGLIQCLEGIRIQDFERYQVAFRVLLTCINAVHVSHQELGLGVVTTVAKSHLGQVVGAEGEKVSVLRDFTGGEGSTGLHRFEFGDVVVDFKRAEVFRGGEPVTLSSMELRLLEEFIEHRGEVLSRDQLLDEVWGYEETPFSRTVDVHVASLRQKLEPTPSHPRYIITVHRRGYRFDG